jgi:hypothetical protein
MSAFEELKRRHIFRAAVLYAGVAWITLQAASMVLPVFHAPDSTSQSLIIIGLIGFSGVHTISDAGGRRVTEGHEPRPIPPTGGRLVSGSPSPGVALGW